MAFYTDITEREAGFAARIFSTLSHWLSGAAEAAARRRTARVTYRELSALSNRELADLGIARSEIRRISLEAARADMA